MYAQIQGYNSQTGPVYVTCRYSAVSSGWLLLMRLVTKSEDLHRIDFKTIKTTNMGKSKPGIVLGTMEVPILLSAKFL